MTRCLVPADVADRWGCAVDFVIDLIKAGQLPAFTLSKPGSVKPRWKIRPEDLEQFELSRRAKSPDKPQRRRRQSAGVIQFF